MASPAPEQEAVIGAKDRIRLVRAVPGSGKTWLVGEVMRRELASWGRRGGIAALSLTHVARKEIERATGGLPGHPHFVGTIDSFLFQHVVKPYAQTLVPGMKNPRITPDEVFDAFSSIDPVPVGNNYVLPHEAVFMPPTQPNPLVLRVKQPNRSPFEVVGTDARRVLNAKQAVWVRTNRLSYSDAHFVAERILARPDAATTRIRRLIARRFPFIVIDELQDTSWFMAHAMLELLKVEDVRALVVGDPNQAIYGFAGAVPEVFDHVAALPGVKEYPLTETQRCCPQVAGAAQELVKNTSIKSSKSAGRAVVVTYDEPPTTLDRLLQAIRAAGVTLNKPDVVVRNNETVRELNAGTLKDAPEFSSAWLSALFRAVQAFLQNERGFFQIAEGAMARAILGEAHSDDETLRASGIDGRVWKTEVGRTLLQLSKWADAETAYEWGLRAKQRADDLSVLLLGKKVKGLRGPATALQGGVKMSECIGRTAGLEIRARTVHQVKGETHEETVFYVPPHAPKACPSAKWWEADQSTTEDGRIAFVASTRPRSTFVLLLPTESWERVRGVRPNFAGAVEVILPKAKGQKDLSSFF